MTIQFNLNLLSCRWTTHCQLCGFKASIGRRLWPEICKWISRKWHRPISSP